MGLPFMSRTRNVTTPGVPTAATVCIVPATDSSHAYSGRAPSATKLTQWLVPLRQATEVACCPPPRGPTIRDLVANPPEFVVDCGLPDGVMPPLVCHGDGLAGSRCTVLGQGCGAVDGHPAATEIFGVIAARRGGVPPLKCACREAPLVSEAVTIEAAEVGAITLIVATPSPVAVGGAE